MGNPKNGPTLPAGCEGSGGTGQGVVGPCGAVVDWDKKINDALVSGGGGSLSGSGYDNLSHDIVSSCGKSSPRSSWEGQYWCTYSIVDSYTLAGFKGMSISNLGGVINMRQWWKSASGYKYADGNNQSALNSMGPGYAIFYESVAGVHNGREHVAEVYKKTIDSRGNGSIDTYDSNSSSKTHHYTVSNWQVLNTPYPVRGFGGH